jgi:predicted Zn-dependent peptidase
VPPTANPSMPESSRIHQHTYPSGLVLVAETMPSVQSAAFTLLLPAGAAYEPADRGGLAAMLAEWVTRGAGDRDSRELLSALDNLGVTHGESAQTLHTSAAAATLGRNLMPALEIFADVVLRPTFDEEEVEPIRALALQNLRSLDDDPGTKVIYELRRRHFPDPWGRPSPGSPEGVAAITPEELRGFHRRRYSPNGAILGVAGAIDWPALRDTVGRLFEGWTPTPEPAVTERATGPARDHILRETQQIQIALAYPAATVVSPDYYRGRAATAILGGYASARLFTEVREKRALCYSVYASYESQRDRAAVLCYAGTSTDRAQETLDVTVAEIRRLAREGIAAEELEMMRAGLKSALIMQQESSMSRSGSLASDWFYLGRVRSLDEIAAALDALTPENVSAYAATQDLDAMTILTLGPNALRFPE